MKLQTCLKDDSRQWDKIMNTVLPYKVFNKFNIENEKKIFLFLSNELNKTFGTQYLLFSL